MERILVGVDGSPAALDALTWATDLARRGGFELIAARAVAPARGEGSPDRDVSLPQDATPADTVLLDGDPPDALLAAAHDRHADLLVVGGRGAGGFARLHLGSVAHHLTHHTTIPLAIVPHSGAEAATHLVVGVDGSPGSLTAIDLCAEMAARLEVPVTAVYAFEPFAEWVPESDPRSWRHKAEADVREWTAAIDKAGVALDIDIDQDIHPVAAIIRALEAHPGSVAVVGTRGLGGFTGLRLGRVPLQLVHRTGAAVIVVPPAERGSL